VATFVRPIRGEVAGIGLAPDCSPFMELHASVSFWLNALTLLGAFILTYQVLGHVASGV
jgi:hypothetical protein